MIQEYLDFNAICRFCTKQSDSLQHIYNNKDKSTPTISSKITECGFIKVSIGDGLPCRICLECTFKITYVYDFKLQCQAAENKLRLQQKRKHNDVHVKDELKKEFNFQIENDPLAEMMIVKNENITIVRKVQDTEKRKNTKSKTSSNGALELAQIVEVPSDSNVKYNIDDLSVSSTEYVEDTNDIDNEHNSDTNDPWEDEAESVKLSEKQKAEPKQRNRRRRIDQCQVCGKLTTGLKQHMFIHNGMKPYKCDYCGKTFSQQGNFKYHLNIHTGNRPFVCSVCGKTCADPNSMKHHMITHTKERNFVCNICGKTFGYSHTLSTHKRSHIQDRRHICSVCDKSFLFNQGLVKHMRIHTGERPYKCEYCGKGCTSSGNLKTHKRVHTREKPYQCHQCERTFSHRSALNMHVKIHEKQSI